MPSNGELAYAAGLFDGEGYVGVSRYRCRQAGVDVRYRLLLTVTNTHRGALEFLQARFGGYIREKGRRLPGRQICYAWRIDGANSVPAFLRQVLPWLIIKKQQAEAAIGYTAVTTVHRGKPLASEESALRDGYYRLLQNLKQGDVLCRPVI